MLFSGSTPLSLAVGRNFWDLAKILLERGAAINLIDNRGKISSMAEYIVHTVTYSTQIRLQIVQFNNYGTNVII